MIFHITYHGKTGVQFASDLINHENKQIILPISKKFMLDFGQSYQ
jgi:hypothetical protein